MLYRSPWDRFWHWIRFKHRITLPYMIPQERTERYIWLSQHVGPNHKIWVSFANYQNRGIDGWRPAMSFTYCFKTEQDLLFFKMRWM